MKLQHLAIVFVIIIIPISLIMGAYIQNQIEAIRLQTYFDTSLINATYDAVKAFQLNTTNNKYSSISDSKIRDIEAAVNTFYNMKIDMPVLVNDEVQENRQQHLGITCSYL